MVSEMLEEIKRTIIQRLPERVQVAKVEFEGPEVVIYTKNPEIITENGNLIRDIAKDIRKRIIIRSDRSVLMDPEKTIKKIHEIVPEEAKITNISFDDVTCEVIIEARKPGLVIGKYGSTSREIVKNTGWAPKILRTPPISSEIIQRIRRTLRKNSKERKKILQQLGSRIHQKPKYDNDWARLTAMGGFRRWADPASTSRPPTAGCSLTAVLTLQVETIRTHTHSSTSPSSHWTALTLL